MDYIQQSHELIHGCEIEDLLLKSPILIQYTTDLPLTGSLRPSLTALRRIGKGGFASTAAAASCVAILLGLNVEDESVRDFFVLASGEVLRGRARFCMVVRARKMVVQRNERIETLTFRFIFIFLARRSGSQSRLHGMTIHDVTSSSACSAFSSASTISISRGNVRMAAIPVNWFSSAT